MRQTELRGYLPALRRWWPTLLASALVAGVAGAALSAVLPVTYEARSQLLVGPVNATADAQRAAGTLARTYAELIVSETFLEAAISQLQLTETTKELREEHVQASGSNTTRFVVIVAEQDTPQKAAALADFLGDRLILLASLHRADSPEGLVSIIDPAEPPTESSGPRMSVLALAAAMAGGLAALLLIVAAEYFGDRVRDGDDLANAAGHPLLGTIDLRQGSSPLGERDETIPRRIASKVLLGTTASPMSVALVPIDTDDGSALAAQLAGALTDFGKRVTIVTDGPGSAVAARATSRKGVLNILGPQAAPKSTLNEEAAPVSKVSGNPTRKAVGNARLAQASPQPVVDKENSAEVTEKALKDADVVIIASQSLSVSPHGLIWSSVVDATVLVSHEGGSTRKAVRHAAEALTAAGATIIGVVQAKAPRARRSRLMAWGARRQPAS